MLNAVTEKDAPAPDDHEEEIVRSDDGDIENIHKDESADEDAPKKWAKKSRDKGPAVDDGDTDSVGRRISISLRSLVVGLVMFSLIVATCVMTWLYIGATSKLDEQAAQANNYKRAEQIALDYAVNAAIMDYHDLGPWKTNLAKGTTPELKEKLTKAGTAMEQILTPLEWISNAKPLSAKVRSSNNGVYVVDAFVGVMTKTVQAPDSLQSTATYSITIDSNHDWQISDVGGIAGVLGEK